jgi:hypothetical protein
VGYFPPEDGPIPLHGGTASFDLRHIFLSFPGNYFSAYAFNNDGVKTETNSYYGKETDVSLTGGAKLIPTGHGKVREPGVELHSRSRGAWLSPRGSH